jgi:hypothetical protein
MPSVRAHCGGNFHAPGLHQIHPIAGISLAEHLAAGGQAALFRGGRQRRQSLGGKTGEERIVRQGQHAGILREPAGA